MDTNQNFEFRILNFELIFNDLIFSIQTFKRDADFRRYSLRLLLRTRRFQICVNPYQNEI